MVYELPSSFSGGMQGAVESLKKGILPQATKPVVVPPAPMITQEQKTFLPQKPKPVDPNKTPDVFKAKFVAKYPEGVAQDGRKYKDMPAVEIVAKIVRKYPNGVTSDGIPYTDFLPRPASSSDSLEYRLSQIESLYGGPKSQFFTDGIMRGQTEKEQQFTTNVTKREKEGELVKTLKAPYRAVYSAMETPSQGLQMAVSDVLDLVGADETSKNLTKQLVKDKFEQDMLNQDNKGLIGGIQAGSPSSIIGSLVTAIPNLLLYANPVGATAGIVSTGGGLSLEGEMQGQTGFGDKVIAYSAGTISGLIDKISGQKFIDGLLSKGIEKNVAKSFVDKTINFLKTLKPSDFEAGTEVIQQKIENWGRQLMGTEYDKGWKQYAEAGIMGKLMGKVSDVGQSQAPITTLPPKQPKAVSKNLDVIQSIKTGIIGNKIIKQAKNRGFDPELDIATYEDLKPTITNDGRVNTDVAQENLQNFIEPYQEKLDQAIAEEGAFVPSETFRQNVLKEMESEKTNIVDYDKWVKMANNAIDSAVQSFGDEKGNIPLEVVNNIKKKLQSVSNYQNPDDSAYKAIARGAKQIVEDFTSSADVRALNKDLARWYTTKEYLQILGSGTKTVKGGRLGKGFARLAGVIIGSKLGPVAGMIGGEIGARLQGKMMQGALKSTKKGIPDILSFGKIKKKQQLLLPPPSGKPTSAKVVDVKPIAGFLPGLLQKSESALSRQISSNNTEDKTTQSQLVQVLGGKRKKEVVSPKKESAGKKVNNPIIQKLAKKQETPKTPQVEGKTVGLPIKPRDRLEYFKERIKGYEKGSMQYENVSRDIKDTQKFLALPDGTRMTKGKAILEKRGDKVYAINEEAKQIAKNSNLTLGKDGAILEDVAWNPVNDFTPDKKSLPLSQKSEVKYSKPDLVSEASWKGLQEKNPDLFNTGILRRSQKPMNAKGVIPEDVHSAQSKWHNLGQNAEVPAKTIYKRVDSGAFKGEYEDMLGNPIRNSDGSILQDVYDDASGQYIEPMVSNKELKDYLLESFSTKEGKKYLDEVISALPKDKNGLITAYRIGNIGDTVQSYTLSEGMAKTFSHQGTDIPLPGTPYLPAKGYKDFGPMQTNVVKIDPKGIRAWSPYDAEILVEGKYVNKANKSSLPMSAKSEVKYSEPDTLVQEARKYNSAEEFIDAQKLYHGTSQDKYKNILKTGFKTPRELAKDGRFEVMMIEDHISFTGDKNVATRYALRDPKGGKLVEIDKTDLNLLTDKNNTMKPDEDWTDYLQRLQKEGYDGIDGQLGHKNFMDYYGTPGEGDTEVLIWNVKKIKEITKEREQELKKIWNKANKK